MSRTTILVVDESPTILKLVELVLAKEGLAIAAAASSQDALTLAREAHPALLLVDYDQLAVCDAFDDSKEFPDLAAIVMSSKGADSLEKARAHPRVIDGIAKPFSPDAIVSVISHALSLVGGHANEPSSEPPSAAKTGEPVAAGEKTADGIPTSALEGDVTPDAPNLAPPAGSVLAGDLAAIALPDVYRLLRDQQQTGELTIHHGRIRLEVFFQQGSIDFATAAAVPEEFLLGRFLVAGGHITSQALSAALAPPVAEAARPETPESQEQPPPMLGQRLLASNLVTPAGLRAAMTAQTQSLLFESLRWGNGHFYFRNLTELPTRVTSARLQLGVDSLLLQAFRRVDEWRLIEQAVGGFDAVFIRDEDRLNVFGRAQLLSDEATVLEHVNGRNTVREIVSQTRMGSFEVNRMLYRLLSTKLIRRRLIPVVTG